VAVATPSSRVSDALAALGRAKLRLTPQRVAIVRAFVDDETHPTAQQIFERLHGEMPTMSFATVYNTLAALERAGSCRALRIGGLGDDGSSRFDPNASPHDHAVCDLCGSVRDVHAHALGSDDRDAALALDGAFEVRAIERVYRGVCARCRKPASARAKTGKRSRATS
jgi:Fur family peroxide stress response transcriptional regulator